MKISLRLLINKKGVVKRSPRYDDHTLNIDTPFKNEEEQKQAHYRKESRGGHISGNKNEFNKIKMLDFEEVEESRIEKKEDTNVERDSTIKQFIALYGEKMSTKLSHQEVKSFIEAGIKQVDFGEGYKQAKPADKSLLNKAKNEHKSNSFYNDDKISNEISKRASRELESTKEKLSEYQVRNERLIFELKAKDSELAIEIK